MNRLIDYPESLPKPSRFIKAVAQRMQGSSIPDVDLEIAFDWLKEAITKEYEAECSRIERQEESMMGREEDDD